MDAVVPSAPVTPPSGAQAVPQTGSTVTFQSPWGSFPGTPGTPGTPDFGPDVNVNINTPSPSMIGSVSAVPGLSTFARMPKPVQMVLQVAAGMAVDAGARYVARMLGVAPKYARQVLESLVPGGKTRGLGRALAAVGSGVLRSGYKRFKSMRRSFTVPSVPISGHEMSAGDSMPQNLRHRMLMPFNNGTNYSPAHLYLYADLTMPTAQIAPCRGAHFCLAEVLSIDIYWQPLQTWSAALTDGYIAQEVQFRIDGAHAFNTMEDQSIIGYKSWIKYYGTGVGASMNIEMPLTLDFIGRNGRGVMVPSKHLTICWHMGFDGGTGVVNLTNAQDMVVVVNYRRITISEEEYWQVQHENGVL